MFWGARIMRTRLCLVFVAALVLIVNQQLDAASPCCATGPSGFTCNRVDNPGDFVGAGCYETSAYTCVGGFPPLMCACVDGFCVAYRIAEGVSVPATPQECTEAAVRGCCTFGDCHSG